MIQKRSALPPSSKMRSPASNDTSRACDMSCSRCSWVMAPNTPVLATTMAVPSPRPRGGDWLLSGHGTSQHAADAEAVAGGGTQRRLAAGRMTPRSPQTGVAQPGRRHSESRSACRGGFRPVRRYSQGTLTVAGRKGGGTMERPLVVGVDGSDSSLEAVDWAVDEARRHRLAVRLVRGSRWARCERRLPALGAHRPSGVIMAESIAASCAEHARLRNPELKVSGRGVARGRCDQHRGRGPQVAGCSSPERH
ncbi:universal stress protein [Streptomyces sp. B4I13]|uniref:universal stress protein n=1 Tax=Streptomyces sp. B4I13 TaxID=3042271 RepID=UPI0035946110